MSPSDTLSTITDEEGIFRFAKVKSATYTLSILHVGFKPLVAKFRQNDAIPRIVMNPILLGMDNHVLNTVEVKARPAIIYKTDTVEYTAKDYMVRKNATIDELLKKMEGMEVSRDGALTHQGEVVKKAKLNGKVFMNGDVANAIQNLPAEIVERIQIVNDYGDQAARTGIKSGESEKTLNIFTKADKSIGNMLHVQGGAGEEERHDGAAFGTRINGNRNIGVHLKTQKVLNGVGIDPWRNQASGFELLRTGNMISADSFEGSAGADRKSSAVVSFRDMLHKTVSLSGSYTYQADKDDLLNTSTTQWFSTYGNTSSVEHSRKLSDARSHDLKIELEADITKYDFLRFVPTLNLSSETSFKELTMAQTGVLHQDLNSRVQSSYKRPNLGTILFYQHFFKKPRRNFSVQFSLNQSRQNDEDDNAADVRYYQAYTALDSTRHYGINRYRMYQHMRISFTFTEPLNDNSQLEFNTQLNRKQDDDETRTGDLNGQVYLVDSLSRRYLYNFTQSRVSVNYRWGLSKSKPLTLSAGMSVLPYHLYLRAFNNGVLMERRNFKLIPILRVNYALSRQHHVSLYYNGNLVEPVFEQIQPLRNVSDPQHSIVGNPKLKAMLYHNLNAAFNNYIINKSFTYNFSLQGGVYEDAIISHTLQLRGSRGQWQNETRFVNKSGPYRLNGNYLFSKLYNRQKITLSYTGNFAYNHSMMMSNNQVYAAGIYDIQQRLKLQTNPLSGLELNPALTYLGSRMKNNLPGVADRKVSGFSLNLDSRFTASHVLTFGTTMAKYLLSGNAAYLSQKPLIMNAYVEHHFLEGKAAVTLQAYDILKQNRFISRSFTGDRITDKFTNPLSRYLMLRFTLKLQKWTAYQPKGDFPLRRRGDGSFMER